MSRNLFLGSLSVDYGFNGIVLDIPNQVFYKEEMSDDMLGIEDMKPFGTKTFFIPEVYQYFSTFSSQFYPRASSNHSKSVDKKIS